MANFSSLIQKRNSVRTRQGNRVIILAQTNDKLIANIYSANNFSNRPTQMKYNLDGTLYGNGYESPLDLVAVA